jgi:PPOX class probable F420-dependent enzyme
MNTGPLPPSIEEFLREPNLMVIATVRDDGRPQSVPSWYEYRDGRLVVNMDAGRARLKHMRKNPNVAVTVMWHKNWFRHVSFIGRVVDIYDDVGMVEIDRLANRYIGIPYKNRERPRVGAKIAIDGWFAWDATTFTEDGVAKPTQGFVKK